MSEKRTKLHLKESKTILLIDNYDSFTHNLYQYIKALKYKVVIVKNDDFVMDDIKNFDAIILSPGPGLPKDAGQMMNVIDRYHAIIPMLGVCLGFQAIAEYFGAELSQLPQVYHGISSRLVNVSQSNILYQNLAVNDIKVGRYHSWGCMPDEFPKVLKNTSESKDGFVMSFSHSHHSLHGIQYHPESILSNYGKQILENFCHSI